MKTIAIITLIFLVFTGAAAIDCASGFYDLLAGSGTRCYQCSWGKTTCTTTNHTYDKKLSGYTTTTAAPTPYCPAGIGYNKEKNLCESVCKEGCSACVVDYDYCTECFNGYTWNPDNTCLPAVIGLEAASLAFLAIGLVFSVIGCCYVNKARK
jgi:hypothetical protein